MFFQVEKEWREKEKAAAQKRKDQAEDMRRGRQAQMDDLRRLQALEIEKDEQEFHNVNKVQRELFEKEMEARRLKREANVRHRKELLKQIDQKERERIIELKNKFEEGKMQLMEREIHNITIEQMIDRKINKLV